MTDLNYNLNREQAAELLGISTRTLDRYIRGGKLSYKKIANRIFLDENELKSMEESLNQVVEKQDSQHFGNYSNQLVNPENMVDFSDFDSKIMDKLDQIAQGLNEKDALINEKNNQINILQQKVIQLEFQLQHSIALPDYSTEKEQFLIDKEKSEIEKSSLKSDLLKEKFLNMIIIGLIIIFILIYIFI